MRLDSHILLLVGLLVSQGFAEEVCETGPIDLVFLIDDSGSVGTDNYQLALQSAVSFTKALEIGVGPQKSRVGVVIFDDTARLGFGLDDYHTNADVASAIMQSSYTGQGTAIAAGMDFALTQVFKKSMRDQPKVMLLITDGDDKTDVVSVHRGCVENNITTYALGVGKGVNVTKLTEATGSEENVFLATDFTALEGIITQVCHHVEASVSPPTPALLPESCGCEDEKLVNGVNYWLDIIFVIDSSNGVSDLDFKSVKALVSSFSHIQIGPTASGSGQYSRVAIVNAAAQAEVIANLTTFKTGEELRIAVRDKLNKKGGRVFNVQAGLQAAQNIIEQEEAAQRRLNVRKVVILFSTVAVDCQNNGMKTNGVSNGNTDVLCSLISIMEGEKTSLVAVGIKLAGSSEYPYIDIVNKCNSLENDHDMTMNLLRVLCRANCYCLPPYTQFTVKDQCDRYAECLYVHDMSLSYMSAEDTCHDENSFVANVLSEEKGAFLKELHLEADFFPYWIGMRNQNGAYLWDDGRQLGSRDYSNWCTDKSQPDLKKGAAVYEYQCKGFNTGWFSAVYGAMVPTNYFSCQTSACSVDNYCEFMKGRQLNPSAKKPAEPVLRVKRH